MILLAIFCTASIFSLIFPVGREKTRDPDTGAAAALFHCARATVLKSSSRAAMRPVSD